MPERDWSSDVSSSVLVLVGVDVVVGDATPVQLPQRPHRVAAPVGTVNRYLICHYAILLRVICEMAAGSEPFLLASASGPKGSSRAPAECAVLIVEDDPDRKSTR